MNPRYKKKRHGPKWRRKIISKPSWLTHLEVHMFSWWKRRFPVDRSLGMQMRDDTSYYWFGHGWMAGSSKNKGNSIIPGKNQHKSTTSHDITEPWGYQNKNKTPLGPPWTVTDHTAALPSSSSRFLNMKSSGPRKIWSGATGKYQQNITKWIQLL